MGEKIKLNKQGYLDYMREIEKKEKELDDLRMYKGTDAIYQGDNWHDNPTLYRAELQERALMKEISELKYELENNIEIVEREGDEDLIDIGDLIKVVMILPTGAKKEKILKLIATMPNLGAESDITEISINSPAGEAIYHKKIGDIVGYSVGDREFTIEIIERVVLDLDDHCKVLK